MRKYLFFSPPVVSAGIEITGIGRLRIIKKRWPTTYRILDGYNLSLILKGRAVFQNPSTALIQIKAGDCLIIAPGQKCLFVPENNAVWEEWWCQFRGPVIRTLDKEGIINTSQPLYRPHPMDTVKKLFLSAFSMARKKEKTGLKRLPVAVLQLLNEVMLSAPAKTEKAEMNKPAAAIAALVRSAPEREWNFQDLAKSHGISYPLLFNQFRAMFRTSPHRFLNLERMKLASHLLTHGLTVTETCFYVGLKDPYHFSRLFKNVIGKAPKTVYAGYRGHSQTRISKCLPNASF